MSKTILITGGTGKVGAQFVKHFFKQGLDVIFTGLTQSEIDILCEKNSRKNQKNKCLGVAVDLTQKKGIEKIVTVLKKHNSFPHCLINAARSLEFLKVGRDGVTQRSGWLGEFTLDVVVPYELSMMLAKHSQSRLENIINISSMYGIVPPNPYLYENPERDSPIQYGVCKAALIHLTKELSVRLASKGIRVNTISYGGVEGRVSDAFKQKYKQLCPLGKMLTQDQVIGAVAFLASDGSIGMTGHNTVVDGGWSVW